MTLRGKALLITLTTAFLAVGILYFFSRHIVLDSFHALEDAHAQRELLRVHRLVEQRGQVLGGVVQDWSAWDDTYQFVAQPSQAYLDSNTPTATLADLRLALLVITDPQGRPLVGLTFDPATQRRGRLPAELWARLREHYGLLRPPARPTPAPAIVTWQGRVYQVAQMGVTTSDKQSPPRGILLMGRRLDPEYWRQLGRTALLDITTTLPPPGVRSDSHISPLDAETLLAEAVLPDQLGDPALVYQLRLPRPLWRQAQETLHYFFLAAALLGFLVLGVSLVLWEGVLLSRLKRIIREVTGIGRLADPVRRLTPAGHDELGELTTAVNQMLEAVHHSRQSQEETENLHRAVTAMAACGILIAQAGRYVFANPAAEIITGRPAGELIQGNLQLIIHPDDRDRVEDYYFSRLAGGASPDRYETRLVRPDGEVRWVEVAASLTSYRGHGATVATVFDITDRKTAQSEVEQSRQALTTILESLPVAVMVVGRDRRIRQANRTALDLLGYQHLGQLTGRFCHATVCPAGEQECPVLDLGCHLDRTERRLFTRDGREVPILKSVVEVALGAEVVLVEAFIDISDLKRAEQEKDRLTQQLLQAQKMEAVGALAGGIAHDFNNILQVLGSGLDLLRRRTTDPVAVARLGRDMERSVARGSRLVRRLLTFSRKLEPEYRELDLNREISAAVEILERALPKMVSIVTELDPRLPLVSADPQQVEQVLLNLGNNARDAMPEGGRLNITTRLVTAGQDPGPGEPPPGPGDWVLLEVADSGQGMDANTEKHIFEPFFSTKELGQGTGLGLAMVYGIVNAHGGAVSCHTAPGQGACFRIYLPAPAHAQPPARPPAAAVEWRPPGRGREMVLLVDDEESIRYLGREILTEWGYQVLTAASGEEALEIYATAERRPELVILDLGMPGMGGAKALRQLRRFDPQVKVLVATGYNLSAEERHGELAAAAGFLRKPYRASQLLEKVVRVLHGAGRQPGPGAGEGAQAGKRG
ncbi:MAG: PAS domain S-box protein [Deltaproteobacteria bacterium]|nr:PAS domain S-box protein [Deltaproteobacteria bacterium]